MKNKADQPSRKIYFQGEWILNWYITDLDLLFLCRLHNQFQKYVSYRTTPETIAVDTFSFSWSDLTFHSFLPFSCISKCLQKIKTEISSGIIVFPNWLTKPYYVTLKKMLKQPPVLLKNHPENPIPTFPECQKKLIKVQLLICYLSGKHRDKWLF